MADEQNNAPEQGDAAEAEAVVEAPKEKSKRWYRGRYSDSRRHRDNKGRVEKLKTYSLTDGVELLKSLASVKFDESVECTVRLGIDPKKTDQLIRGAVSLPHGIGKDVRVIAFAEGEKAKEAEAAGAEVVGSEDLAKRIQDGWLDFDVAIAAPDMMKYVGRLGRVLGPQGKMPSPKAGTVTPDVGQAVAEFRAGKIEFRTDSGANVAASIGKRSFSTAALAENARAFVNHLRSLKPAQARGSFIVRVVLASTMGPGIRVDLADGGSDA